MPLINVKVINGVFTPEQKTQIAERLTDAMVSSRARTCAA
jgi:phenylpyruvate tautomerase PptA (4-oxalocrotonate tautomerase family)